MEISLSDNEIEKLQQEQSRKIDVKDHKLKIHKLKSLEEHFNIDNTKDERNSAIINAIDDGHTQSSIAKHLGISTSTVSKVTQRWS